MSREATAKATEAADALLDWLASQPARSTSPSPAALPRIGLLGDRAEGDLGGDVSDKESVIMPDAIVPSGGRLSDAPAMDLQRTMRLPTPDWLHHRLTISGAVAEVERFRRAATGAGIIPWHLNLERMEEDYFHLLVSPEQRRLSVAGARLFARQLRDAVGRRHELAISRVGRSRACPFDLHALSPVPHDILVLGPDDPRALVWLWEHWGTTEALRHVAVEGGRGKVDGGNEEGVGGDFRVSFWSADWTPWRALNDLGSRWPTLRFEIRPTYDQP